MEVFTVLVFVSALVLVSPLPAQPSWSPTSGLITGRAWGHTATLLPSGKVMVAGGAGRIRTVELYDPAMGTWSSTGNLITGRAPQVAILLPDGKVLVAGGNVGSTVFDSTNTAELYDPSSGTWSGTPNLTTDHVDHTATLLPNGKVLVVGNHSGTSYSAEMYDPATNRWSVTSDLITGRAWHTATLLPNGKVLVAGGHIHPVEVGITSAELYDPAAGAWSRTGELNTGRFEHTATLLPNGKVLVVGGWVRNFRTNTAELYDPASGTWSVTGSPNDDRAGHTATLLPNGKVLVVGGLAGPGSPPLRSAELYDPATGTWSLTVNLNGGRSYHTATLLANGKVLVTGGGASSANTAELYEMDTGPVGLAASVSAASYSGLRLASESIVATFGSALATATASAATVPLPTELGGTTVRVWDSTGIQRLAPLFFASPTQVNYQIPPGTAPGTARVIVTRGDGTISSSLVQVAAVAPAIFTANQDGRGVPVAAAVRTRADGSQISEPVAFFDAAQNRFLARPIDLGPATDQVALVLFATGIRFRSSLASVTARVGGVATPVMYAGAQGEFVGVDQVNLLLPRTLAGRGEMDVVLTVDEQVANLVRVSVR